MEPNHSTPSDIVTIEQLVSVCHIHLNQVEYNLTHGDVYKAEVRAGELQKAADELKNVLYRFQRVSGRVL
jgi:lipopolysaccharide biosynthesis protein